MCGLCGILGEGHWADGVRTVPSASAVPWLRRQARRERVVLGNAVLKRSGLSLADWQGAGFMLCSRTGSAQMVGTLSDLWPKADRVARQPLDPLDPAFLDALDAVGRE